jgi:thioesterase domain-containing protein
VWLDHQVGEHGAALVFNWDAVEALFPDGLLDSMFDRYRTRLGQLAADDGAWTTAPAPPADAAVAAGATRACDRPAGARDTGATSPHTFVAPRDEVERQIAAIWEDVLDVHPVGVTDPFFDLGGNSFLAARVMIRVQQHFGRGLPVSALLEADTVERLARTVCARHSAPAPTTLVRLATGSAPPFFCVHPIGGSVMCYAELARCLGEARDVYGLQARGLQGEAAPFTDIETMAAHYLGQIRRVWPDGPYLIGGWSMGGTVAFEIARQLAAQGEETRRLVLLDTETGTVARSDRSAVRRPGPAYEVPADADPEQLEHLLRVVTCNDRALAAYRERTYGGPLTLIRAREQPEGRSRDLGWSEFVAGALDVRTVPGDHYTMLQRPNVYALGTELRLLLEADDGERVSHS